MKIFKKLTEIRHYWFPIFRVLNIISNLKNSKKIGIKVEIRDVHNLFHIFDRSDIFTIISNLYYTFEVT